MNGALIVVLIEPLPGEGIAGATLLSFSFERLILLGLEKSFIFELFDFGSFSGGGPGFWIAVGGGIPGEGSGLLPLGNAAFAAVAAASKLGSAGETSPAVRIPKTTSGCDLRTLHITRSSSGYRLPRVDRCEPRKRSFALIFDRRRWRNMVHSRLRRDLRCAQTTTVRSGMGQRRLKKPLTVLPRTMSDLLSWHIGRCGSNRTIHRCPDLVSLLRLQVAGTLRWRWTTCGRWSI